MSAVVLSTAQPQRRSIVATMATNYGMEPAAFEATIRATCMPMGRNEPPASREEFAAFVLVCDKYGLNPITREIYAMRRRGGGIIPVVSVDGWLKKINEHPQFDGMTFEDIVTDKGALVAVTCRIYRKDRTHPTVITEYLDECYRDTDPWKMKRRMLRHKSLVQCARYAFGFAGVYDEDEAERITGSPAPAVGYIEHQPEPDPDAPADEQEPDPDAQQESSEPSKQVDWFRGGYLAHDRDIARSAFPSELKPINRVKHRGLWQAGWDKAAEDAATLKADEGTQQQGQKPLNIEELRSEFLTALHEARSADNCKEAWNDYIEPVKAQLPESDLRDLQRIQNNAIGTFSRG